MQFKRIKGRGNEHLFRYSDNDVIYVKKYAEGKAELRRSTGTKDLSLAKIKRDEFLRAYFGEAPKIKKGREFISTLFPAWIERKRSQHKADSTLEGIENTWRRLRPFIEDLLPEDITTVWWESTYVPKMRENDAEQTFFNDRKYLTMFLTQMVKDGRCTTPPGLAKVDKKTAKALTFTDEQLRALFRAAETQENLYLQIKMAFTQGMRIKEIMTLEWDRINMTDRTIHIPAHLAKIRVPRTFQMSPTVYELLKARPNQSGPLFPNPRNKALCQGRQGNKKAWASAKKRAGIDEKYRFHWLRHTFLTRAFAVESMKNPILICEYAGLSMAEAQKTYLHLTHRDTAVVASLVA